MEFMGPTNLDVLKGHIIYVNASEDFSLPQ